MKFTTSLVAVFGLLAATVMASPVAEVVEERGTYGVDNCYLYKRCIIGPGAKRGEDGVDNCYLYKKRCIVDPPAA